MLLYVGSCSFLWTSTMLLQRADFPHEQIVCPSNMSAALGGLVRSPLDLNEACSAKPEGVGIFWGGVFLNCGGHTLASSSTFP